MTLVYNVPTELRNGENEGDNGREGARLEKRLYYYYVKIDSDLLLLGASTVHFKYK